jgi:GTPase
VSVIAPGEFRAGFVAVVGRPNVGKSTFVNALVGTKVSIVSDKPQTTRNRILAVVNRPAGQMVLFDTPGIHKPEHGLNRRMVETAVRSIGMVEVVFWIVSVTERYGPGDRYVREILHKAKRPVLLGLNKIDLIPKPQILRVIDQYRNLLDFADIVPLSALSGDNVELAGEQLLAHLPVGDALYPEDFLTDRPERFFAAEMIREQILILTRQEMPYVTGVVVESFKEEGELVRIEASILAERDSQKAILIGKGGSMLKEIGTRARKELEAFLASRVYLGLFVKVRQNWRENGAVLDEMGLGEGEAEPHKRTRKREPRPGKKE